jgi:hypothetical protein
MGSDPRYTIRLEHDQRVHYDGDHLGRREREILFSRIEECFGDRQFTHLDVRGGSGLVADRLLERFPNCRSTVIDYSEELIQRNRPHERKKTICGFIEDIDVLTGGEHFDLITANNVLHHLILESYGSTRRHQTEVVRRLAGALSLRGRLFVAENAYEGALVPELTGFLIFTATSSRLLTPLALKHGANTAGVGVCFLPERQWRKVFREAGLRVRDFRVPREAGPSLAQRFALGMRWRRSLVFWLETSPPPR